MTDPVAVPAPGAARAPVLLATRNAKKLAELRRILGPLVEVEVIGLNDVVAFDEVAESGATFAANALIKAHAAFARTGLLTVADDSGLCVDALNGMPGVLSARWSGHAATDAGNRELVLAQLTDTPDERLGARFECAVAVVHRSAGNDVDTAGEQVVHGRMPGRLVRSPRGAGGFGYDSIFVPEGLDRTSAELSATEKDAISHRGRALRALAPVLAAMVRGADVPS